MSTINELSNAVLILIRAGTIFRVAFLFFQGIVNPDDFEAIKKRIWFSIKFYVIAELVFVMKIIIMAYY